VHAERIELAAPERLDVLDPSSQRVERVGLATVPGKGWFALIRLYGQIKAAIDKSWKPGDIKVMK
jgi:hypothetical protein